MTEDVVDPSFEPATQFFLEELKFPETADRRLQNAIRLCLHNDCSSKLVPELINLYHAEDDPRVIRIHLITLLSLFEKSKLTPEQILDLMDRPILSWAWVKMISDIVEKYGRFETKLLPQILDSLGRICFRQKDTEAQVVAIQVLANFIDDLSPKTLAAVAFCLGSESVKAKRHALDIIASTKADIKGLIPALFNEYQMAKSKEVQFELGNLIQSAAPEQVGILGRLLRFCNHIEKPDEHRQVKIPPGYEEIFHFSAKIFLGQSVCPQALEVGKVKNICSLSHFYWLACDEERDEEEVAERLELLLESGAYSEYLLDLFREILADRTNTPEQIVFEAAAGLVSLGCGTPEDLEGCCPIILNGLRSEDPNTAIKARYYASSFLGIEHCNLGLRTKEALSALLVADDVSDLEKTEMIRSWDRHKRRDSEQTEAYLQLLAPLVWNKYSLYSPELQLVALRYLLDVHLESFDSETKQEFTLLLADLVARPEATIELKEMHRRCEKSWLLG